MRLEMESLIASVASSKQRVYVAIIVTFAITNLLNRSFECTCKSQTFDCIIYMGLPILMIFLLMLWTNSSFQRVFKYTCDGTRCSKCHRFYSSFLRHFLKAILVSVLWVAYVFFFGDWYVCCANHLSDGQAQLPCKIKSKLTAEEKQLITELNNESKASVFFCVVYIMCFNL